MMWLHRVRAGIAALLCAGALYAPRALAQGAAEIITTGTAPAVARFRDGNTRNAAALVVDVRSRDADGEVTESGAGVIIALDSVAWIVTARHVVAQEVLATRTWLRYATVQVRVLRTDGLRDSLTGTAMLLDSAFLAAVRADRDRLTEPDSVREIVQRVLRDSTLIASYDLAIVRVDAARLQAIGWRPPTFDRLGDPKALRRGDDLTPIGCPNGLCWTVPIRANQFVDWLGTRGRSAGTITFQSSSVAPGNSGGALFNRWYELVGLVLKTDNQLATAVPIDEVVAVLQRASVPVHLRASRYPRAGYTTALQFDVLSSVGATAVPDSLMGDGRAPSVRLTWSVRSRSALGWHAAMVRLAPQHLVLHAATAGADYTLRVARWTLTVATDLGLGQVTARHDIGGYRMATGGVGSTTSRYVPVWDVERATSTVIGGGATLAWLMRPRLALTASAARWSYGTTAHAVDVPRLQVGGGLRWNP